MDRDKIIKMVVALAAIVIIATSIGKLFNRNSMSLSEYAELNGVPTEASPKPSVKPDTSEAPASASPTPENDEDSPTTSPAAPSSSEAPTGTSLPPKDGTDGSMAADPSDNPEDMLVSSSLTGASLNGTSQLEERVSLEKGFYYEPISDNLRRYMTGISYPAEGATAEAPGAESSAPQDSDLQDSSAQDSPGDPAAPEITFDELRYVHILHYDFDGEVAEGELVCNELIAADLAEIFQELYRNEYRLEKVLLIDEYEGDDTASMEDNNTSCFNYRTVDDTDRLSRHAYGLAIDINPLYNPYITYTEDGTEKVSPASALPYADRDAGFPYKIDEDDLCYKLFTRHGFTWGGNWNNMKDYQHFQKTP